MRSKAFSLIELLVVVAIIAILAVVAIPMYLQYSTRVTLSNAITYLFQQLEISAKSYSVTGYFPCSFNMFGNTFTIGGANPAACIGNSVGWGTISNPPYNVYQAWYGISSDGKGVEIAVTFTNLPGVPGFSQGAPNANCSHCTFKIGVRDNNGTMAYVCGSAGSGYSSYMIPSAFLPSNCNCLNAQQFLLGTSATC